MGISENIKLLREQYGLSQKELGQIAGVSDKAVSTWEQGIKEPRMGAIQKIADHFGIQKSNIIEDNGLQSQSVPLTPRDERQIAADLEKILADLDSKNSMAAVALGIKPSQLMGIGEPAGTSGPRIVKMPPIELNQPERELITKYRRLDDDGKDRINRQVDFELYQLEKSAQKGEVNCG